MTSILRDRKKYTFMVFLMIIVAIVAVYMVKVPELILADSNSRQCKSSALMLERMLNTMSNSKESGDSTIAKDGLNIFRVEEYIENMSSDTEKKYEKILSSAVMSNTTAQMSLVTIGVMVDSGTVTEEQYNMLLAELRFQKENFDGIAKMSDLDIGLNRQVVLTAQALTKETSLLIDRVLNGESYTLEEVEHALDSAASIVEGEFSRVSKSIKFKQQMDFTLFIMFLMLIHLAYTFVMGTKWEREEAKREIRSAFDELKKIKSGFYEIEDRLLGLYSEDSAKTNAGLTEKSSDIIGEAEAARAEAEAACIEAEAARAEAEAAVEETKAARAETKDTLVEKQSD